MRILQSGDWHFALGNLDQTVPAARHIAEVADDLNIDVVVNPGDFVVNRGPVHPEVSLRVREAVYRLDETASIGSVIVRGNHDDSYNVDQADTVSGILGAIPSARVRLAVMPEVVVLSDGDLRVAFVCVPAPNKYMLAAATDGEATLADASQLLESVIRGLIAEARQQADRVVVVYHGSIDGARSGDELVMNSGIEVSVRRSCFTGADAVMLGHIHQEQAWFAPAGVISPIPPIAYAGSIAPLNWGERKLAPIFLVWDVSAAGVTVERHEIPVTSQMIDLAVNLDGADDVRRKIIDAIPADVQNARVRIKASGPAAHLATLDQRWQDAVKDRHQLRDFMVVPVPTDAGLTRMSLATDWTLADAFDRYLDLKDVDQALRPGLAELFREIEDQVTDRDLDARFDFRPVRMWATNWCQYRELEVDFNALGRATAITGENYAGKSNLTRLLLFLLYKHQVSGRTNAALVRIPEKRFTGGIDFVSSGITYRVCRELAIGSTRATSGSFTLSRVEADGKLVPLNAANAGKTQEALEQLIGPRDLFMVTSYSGQNRVDEILDLTPGELKDCLMAVLHRDFEGRQDIARARLSVHNQTLRDATAEATSLRTTMESFGELADTADLEAKIAQSEQRMTTMPDGTEQDGAIAAGERALADLNAKVAGAASHRAALARADEMERKTRAGLEEAIAAKAQAAGLKESLRVARDELAVMPDGSGLQEDIDRQAAVVADLKAKAERRDRLELDVEALVSRVASCRGEVDAVVSSEQEAADLQARIEAMGEVDLEAAAGKVSDLQAAITAASDRHNEMLAQRRAKMDEVVRAKHYAAVAHTVANVARSQCEIALAVATERSGKIGDVPCGGDVWWQSNDGMPGRPGVDMGACPLIADARAAKDSIPQLQADLEAARIAEDTEALAVTRATVAHEEAVAEGIIEAGAISDERARLASDLGVALLAVAEARAGEQERRDAVQALALARQRAARRPEADAALAAANEALVTATTDLEDAGAAAGARQQEDEKLYLLQSKAIEQKRAVEAAQRALHEMMREYAVAETKAGLEESLQADLVNLAAVRAASTEALEGASHAASLVAATEAELAAIRSYRETQRSAVAIARDELGRLQAALQAAQAQREAVDGVKSRLDAAERLAATTAATVAQLEFYAGAMHRDGLPFLLLEQFAIPQLRGAMNRYLTGVGFQAVVESERALAGGETRNAVNLSFVDHRGQHDASAASGAQRTVLAMAMRAAMADIHATATGSAIWLVVQDEGFGTLDAKHLPLVQQMIRTLAEARGQYVYVSHIPGMSDGADSVIDVTDHGGSSVAVLS